MQKILLAALLQKPRGFLFMHPELDITPDQQQQFHTLVTARQAGSPVAYLRGMQPFWTFELHVTPDVLIPRPETESLIDIILAQFSNEQRLKVVDLGTGSGAIALALASERPHWNITATDVSSLALNVAKANAKRLGLTQLHWHTGYWLEGLTTDFDLIISNPPYIARNDSHLTAPTLQYEPKSALISGPLGLDAIHHLVASAPSHLTPGGCLFLEHGAKQQPAIATLLEQYGWENSKKYQDLNGLPRFVSATWPK